MTIILDNNPSKKVTLRMDVKLSFDIVITAEGEEEGETMVDG